MQTLRHVLVGTDFSPHADAALEYAISLGATRLTLVHVCELELPGDTNPELDEQQLARCRDQLSAIASAHAARGIVIQPLLRTGKPWEKLHNAAAEVGASLIVIGRTGTGGGREQADGHPLGAVAMHVLRRASRPVLMVPTTPYGAQS